MWWDIYSLFFIVILKRIPGIMSFHPYILQCTSTFFFFKKTIFFYISTFCYQTNKIHKNCSVSSNTHPQSHLPGCLTSVILHALLPSRYTHQGHMLLVLTESHPHPPQPPILFKSVTCWRNQVSCFVDGYTFREPLWHHLVYSCVPHISCNGNWALEPRLDSG